MRPWSSESEEPDEDYYRAQPGEILNGRYRVVKRLGCGAFASVWKCTSGGETVAVKIPHNRLGFAAKNELTMLQAAAGPGVVELKASFRFNGGSCFVLEMLHESLLDACCRDGAMAATRVRAITRDLLSALASVHAKGVAHADVKPENVMLTASGSVKLVDFGLAFHQGRRRRDTAPVQTREYRAPEAVLGLPRYTTAIDVWSVACLVFELLTGQYLFDIPLTTFDHCSRDELHLAQAVEVLGTPLPLSMVARCGIVASEWFVKNTNQFKRLNVIIPEEGGDSSHLAWVLVRELHFSTWDAAALTSFLLPMLAFEPATRIPASACLHHPWLDHI